MFLREPFVTVAESGTVAGLPLRVADRAAVRAVARLRQMTDAWEPRLPDTISSATVVDVIRHTLEGVEVPRRMADEAQPTGFVPPAADGLPLGALGSAAEGANRLDAWATDPRGRNFLAHVLVQLARDGWLRSEPADQALFSTPGVKQLAEEIDAERQRQLAKFGDQHHPDGTGDRRWADAANVVRGEVDDAARAGLTTWNGILREELFEVLAEEDPVRLHTELVQVAAVCAAWIADIDSREAAECPECGNSGACNGGPCPLLGVVAEPQAESSTRQCGHDDYHDAHAGRPARPVVPRPQRAV